MAGEKDRSELNYTSTIVLLVAAGALGGYIFFVESRRPSDRDRLAAERLPFGEPVRNLDRFEIVLRTGPKVERIRLARTAGGKTWRMSAPVTDRADRWVAGLVERQLAALRVAGTLDGDPAAYGLEPARARLEFSAGGATRRLDLGNEDPFGARIYARAAGGKPFLAPKTLLEALTRPVEAYRDQDVLSFEPGAIVRVEVETPSRRPSSFVFQLEKGAEWFVIRPFRDRLRGAMVVLLLRSLASLRVANFGGIEGAVAPSVRYRLHRAEAVVEQVEILPGSGKGAGLRPAARVQGRPDPMRLSNYNVVLVEGLDFYRERNFFPTNRAVRTVKLTRGAEELLLAKEPGKAGSPAASWRLRVAAGKKVREAPCDQGKAGAFAALLQGLQVRAFLADVYTLDQLARHGLGKGREARGVVMHLHLEGDEPGRGAFEAELGRVVSGHLALRTRAHGRDGHIFGVDAALAAWVKGWGASFAPDVKRASRPAAGKTGKKK